MLHRLPKAEVYSEGQRGDELCQPDVRTIGLRSHMPRLPGTTTAGHAFGTALAW